MSGCCGSPQWAPGISVLTFGPSRQIRHAFSSKGAWRELLGEGVGGKPLERPQGKAFPSDVSFSGSPV